ncbi:MAG: hypothetical protein Q9227_000188 [Pyrenula ochraceoflavens]
MARMLKRFLKKFATKHIFLRKIRFWDEGFVEHNAEIPTSSRHSLETKNPPPDWHLSKLEKLPPEILLVILSFCVSESGVALCLASKRLYNNFFRDATRTFPCDIEATNRLLRLLEKDIPRLFMCSRCNRLYNWERRASHLDPYACPLHELQDSWYGNPGQPIAARLSGCWRSTSLTVEGRDLIFRAARYGPQYGPSLDYLASRFFCRSTYKSEPYKTFSPRIANNSLMIWTTMTIKVDLFLDLFTQLNCLWESSCRHTIIHIPDIAECALKHLAAGNEQLNVNQRHTGFSDNTGRPKCLQLLKCSYCATDIRIELQRPNEQNVVLTIHTWRDYGNPETDTGSTLQGSHFLSGYDQRQKRSSWHADPALCEFFQPECDPLRFKPYAITKSTNSSTCVMDEELLSHYFSTADN